MPKIYATEEERLIARKASIKGYRDRNKDKQVQRVMTWRKNNEERYKATQKQWYNDNRDSILEYQKEYYYTLKELKQRIK